MTLDLWERGKTLTKTWAKNPQVFAIPNTIPNRTTLAHHSWAAWAPAPAAAAAARGLPTEACIHPSYLGAREAHWVDRRFEFLPSYEDTT